MEITSVETLEIVKKAMYDKRKIILKRFSPMDNIGVDLRDTLDYNTAMDLSGVGFVPVEKELVSIEGDKIPSHKAIFNGDNLVSVVKKGYTTIPNREAFKVAEDLVNNEGFHYEVGSIQNNGGASRLILSGDTTTILGEAFTPYAVLSNSFDGFSGLSLKIMYLRLVCLNGMVREWEDVSSTIWLSHTSTIGRRIEQLKATTTKWKETRTLIEKEADLLASRTFSRDDFIKKIIPQALARMYPPIVKNSILSERSQEHVNNLIATILSAYDSDDLQGFNGTAYKVLLAMADIDSHMETRNKDNNLYINRVLQSGIVGLSLTNLIGNYLLKNIVL